MKNLKTRGELPPVKKVEDLLVWSSARRITHLIYRITSRPEMRSDFDLCRQMRRAAVSIISNIAEGFERNGNREFLQALTVAKGSCGELKSQLCIAADLNYLGQEEFRQLSHSCSELSRMLAGLIKHLKRSQFKGWKFNDT
jgi:four helix bundle protein